MIQNLNLLVALDESTAISHQSKSFRCFLWRPRVSLTHFLTIQQLSGAYSLKKTTGLENRKTFHHFWPFTSFNTSSYLISFQKS